MESAQDEDAMVIVAALVSRVEALVVASMLEAGGVAVTVGEQGHTGVAINALALGGHRLWVPVSQHVAASSLIIEVLGANEWEFSRGLQRAVLRVAGFWAVMYGLIGGLGWLSGDFPLLAATMAPLSALSTPVNPQGRGDYYLVAAD